MKRIVLSVYLFALAHFVEAQVMLRNDFILGPHHKIKNKGLSFIAINLDRNPNHNLMINGRGGKSVVIDVAAIRQPRKEYSYSELAEKIYTPGAVYRPSVQPVPMFLLLPPPSIHIPAFTGARMRNYQ